MSTTAALVIAAQECVDDATTGSARCYYAGVLDTVECLFRAAHDLEDDVDAVQAAQYVLDDMEARERVTLVTGTKDLLRVRRAETVAKTVIAV